MSLCICVLYPVSVQSEHVAVYMCSLPCQRVEWACRCIYVFFTLTMCRVKMSLCMCVLYPVNVQSEDVAVYMCSLPCQCAEWACRCVYVFFTLSATCRVSMSLCICVIYLSTCRVSMSLCMCSFKQCRIVYWYDMYIRDERLDPVIWKWWSWVLLSWRLNGKHVSAHWHRKQGSERKKLKVNNVSCTN